MAEVYLGLGSNVGDREKYIADVLILFHNDADIRLITGSSLYETEPGLDIDAELDKLEADLQVIFDEVK